MITTTAYVDIVKHERDTNGDLLVYGRATSDDLDLDRQICDPAWMAKAMPEWFASGANVREQHSAIAAGVGTELVQDGKAWDLLSRIVDPNSARKVEAGVLKGYSVGIRSPRVVKDAAAPGGRIVDGQIVEVSLVDRPANPTCVLTLAKALKPGPQTASAVDADRQLVKVEELHDRSVEVTAALDAVKALAPFDLVAVRKGDQAGDIADARQAIAIIAGLIQAEAVMLADGAASEACDIDLLLSAVRALEWFICRENKEGLGVATTVDLAAQAASTPPDADATKGLPPAFLANAKDDDAEDDEKDGKDGKGKKKTPPKDADKGADGENDTDLTELVKALTAKVDGLEGQLTKAMNAPAPGGPVLTRTNEDTTKAAAREGHLAKAAEYERTAFEVNDPQARAGYLQLAANARTAATS